MFRIQTNLQKPKIKPKIKVSELTKVHRDILYKYSPLVKKDFSVNLLNATNKEENSADQEYTADVVNFLGTIDAVFGDTPPSNINPQCNATTKDIIEMALASCRSLYREQFRGYSFLTNVKLQNTHELAEKEADLIITQQYIRDEVVDDTDVLKEQISSDLKVLCKWIDEVNNFKKNQIYSGIRTKVLESLQKNVNEKFRILCDNDAPGKFYETLVLRQRIEEIWEMAYENFRQEIPYQDDQYIASEGFQDFQRNIQKILMNLKDKNDLRKRKANQSMTSVINLSVIKYKETVSKIFNEEPLADPSNDQKQHEAIQELHLPILTHLENIPDHWKSKCMNSYAEKTNKIFQKMLLDHNKKSKQAFSSNAFVSQSTVANQDVVENISAHASTSKEATQTHKTSSLATGIKIAIKIRLLDGKTYQVDAYPFWTVESLKDHLAKTLQRSDSAFTLCHKTKKLQNANTIESYNILTGDFLIANI